MPCMPSIWCAWPCQEWVPYADLEEHNYIHHLDKWMLRYDERDKVSGNLYECQCDREHKAVAGEMDWPKEKPKLADRFDRTKGTDYRESFDELDPREKQIIPDARKTRGAYRETQDMRRNRGQHDRKIRDRPDTGNGYGQGAGKQKSTGYNPEASYHEDVRGGQASQALVGRDKRRENNYGQTVGCESETRHGYAQEAASSRQGSREIRDRPGTGNRGDFRDSHDEEGWLDEQGRYIVPQPRSTHADSYGGQHRNDQHHPDRPEYYGIQSGQRLTRQAAETRYRTLYHGTCTYEYQPEYNNGS